MLDPQAASLIALMAERQVPPTHKLTPAEARRMYLERRFYTQPDPPAVAEVRMLTSDTGVPLRLQFASLELRHSATQVPGTDPLVVERGPFEDAAGEAGVGAADLSAEPPGAKFYKVARFANELNQ